MILNVVFTIIKFCIEFGLNPALTVICLFIYILFVCLFTYLISIISCSLKLEQITPPCQLCHAYYKVSNILYQILEDFLNVVFILIKFLIEFGLNPALAVVCLFIYILFVCLFTYFISIISWTLKLEQIIPPRYILKLVMMFFDNLLQNITNLKICKTQPTRRCYQLMLQGPSDY